jgi:hypothetical protein
VEKEHIMEKQARLGKSKYYGSAAYYLPSPGEIRRTVTGMLLLLTVLLIGLATRAHATVTPADQLQANGAVSVATNPGARLP